MHETTQALQLETYQVPIHQREKNDFSFQQDTGENVFVFNDCLICTCFFPSWFFTWFTYCCPLWLLLFERRVIYWQQSTFSFPGIYSLTLSMISTWLWFKQVSNTVQRFSLFTAQSIRYCVGWSIKPVCFLDGLHVTCCRSEDPLYMICIFKELLQELLYMFSEFHPA